MGHSARVIRQRSDQIGPGGNNPPNCTLNPQACPPPGGGPGIGPGGDNPSASPQTSSGGGGGDGAGGNAFSPQDYQDAGSILGSLGLPLFARGFPLDAQASGGSTAYANYVYGVYMGAAGYSWETTLLGATAYATFFSNYGGAVPASNITNMRNGYNAQQNGTLNSTDPKP